MKRFTLTNMLLWLALWLLPTTMTAQDASAIYNATTRVLTLKEYTPNEKLSADETKEADLYDQTKRKYWWDGEWSSYNWSAECKNATRVVIEAGFKNCPLTTCYKMFYNLTSLMIVEGISNLNTASVTNMSSMFYNCSSLKELDLSGLNTASVTNMRNMFSDCYELKELDLSGWNTASVIDMSSMFYFCRSLTALDLSSFNTASVTDMSYMFCDCSGLRELDLSGFNTASVTNMYSMFKRCSGLTKLDLSGWNTASVTKMTDMFYRCRWLKDIYVGDGFIVSETTNDDSMFYFCIALPNYDDSKTDKTLAHYREGGYFQVKVARLGSDPIGAQNTENGLRATQDLVLDRDLEVFRPFTASRVSYSRAAAEGEWQDVYVPFAVDVDVLGAEYEAAMVNNFHEYQQEDGSLHVELEAKQLASGTVSACTPLLMRRKPDAGGDALLKLEATDVAFPTDEGNALDCASLTREYRFEGALATRSGFSTLTDYLMHRGTLCRITDADAQMLPYHWYLRATDIAGSPVTPAAPADRIAIKIVGGEVSAIEETPSADHRQPQRIYDLQGRPLRQAPQHGVYIQNGKKYMK